MRWWWRFLADRCNPDDNLDHDNNDNDNDDNHHPGAAPDDAAVADL